MNKIKIITLHSPLNYGAALQAYALKTYLVNEGYEAELIDYRPDYIMEKQKLTYVGNQSVANNPLKRWAYILVKFPSRYKIKHNFQKFLKKELCDKGQTIYKSIEELNQNPPQADVFFAGSDQIWNTHMENGWDNAFFLTFVKEGRRCSYAASMAISQPLESKEEERFRSMLQYLDIISVREKDAANILQPLTQKQVQWVLDPVFMLSAEQWQKLADKREEDVSKKEYILVYPMGDGEKVYWIAQQLSKQTGLPIYSISRTIHKTNVQRQFNGYTPYQFLHLIQHAKYVVTNSFHGTSFSIIFRKNLWACNIGKTSSRITSLLNSLQLGHRYIGEEAIPDNLTDVVDFEIVSRRLDNQIHSSRLYIDYCLNKINEI